MTNEKLNKVIAEYDNFAEHAKKGALSDIGFLEAMGYTTDQAISIMIALRLYDLSNEFSRVTGSTSSGSTEKSIPEDNGGDCNEDERQRQV